MAGISFIHIKTISLTEDEDSLVFFFFMAYQPSWVIQCQSYYCWTVMVLFNP